MKQVHVRWFAAYRDLTGVESETLDTEATTPAALFDELKGRHPRLGTRNAALVAINDEMSDWSSPLNPGDTVLFFPPVSGG